MKVTVAVVLACASFAVMADAPTPPTPQVSKNGAAIRARIAAKAGGYVYQRKSGKALKIVNCEKAATDAAISAAVAAISDRVLVQTEAAVGSFGPATFADTSAGAWVFVEDCDSAPALLVAPEEGWARVNVRKLKADAPDAQKLQTRVVKEIWRGAAIIMGASDSHLQPSLMRSIKNLKMLDVAPEFPTPDVFNKMMSFAKDREFGTIKKATYRQACKEGWAPAPTNDLQKSIWQKVHEIPETPLKLEK